MTSTETDRGAVEELLAAMAEAWNAGDADAYGALFTEDASYVNFMGQLARGRTEIVDQHRWLFARMPGSRMSGASPQREIRVLGTDTALVVDAGAGVTTSADAKLTADRASAVSLVAVRGADGWRFAHFQNTRCAPPAG